MAVLAFASLFGAPCFSENLASLRAPDSSRTFLNDHCLYCHDSDTSEGGLDLSALASGLDDPQAFRTWVKVHDRVQKGEMPPDGGLEDQLRQPFVARLSEALASADRQRVSRSGRGVVRRLNRFEFENTVRDLLDAPWLNLAERLPEDGTQYGFNRSAGALDVSYIQLSRFLDAADYALHEASAYHTRRVETATTRYYARDQLRFVNTMSLGGPAMRHPFPVFDGKADPRFTELSKELNSRSKRQGRHKIVLETESTNEEKELEAIGVVVSSYEPTEIRFNNFTAPVAGKYRLRLRAYSIWVGGETVWVEPNPKWGLMERARRTRPDFTEVTRGRRDEPITLYSDTSPRSLRKIGAFDVTPEPETHEVEAWLLAGETIRPDAARLFRCRGAYPINPLAVEDDGMPGVAFQWLEVEGPLPVEPSAKIDWRPSQLDRADTEVDIVAAVRSFLELAYRRPVNDSDVSCFSEVAHNLMRDGAPVGDALIGAYKAILCSPEFLYLHGDPGWLNDHTLASRLSYFLLNSSPDEALRGIAGRGALREPAVMHDQVERLLNSGRSQQFVSAFLDYWVDLRKIAEITPDGSLYPEYQLDDLLVESMAEETRAFFGELVRSNLPARNLITSDFAYLNERLATHYGIPGVKGVRLRRVDLPNGCVRGGLLTQAGVLKVTSSATTTSPVLRGVWVAERLLGVQIPPPPENVPAIEPDTRGASSIRDLLARHRADESCASCHRNIDPYGFALEAFDVMGAQRTRYRAVGGDPLTGAGHNGLPFEFHLALPVETDGVLPTGESFEDVAEMKRLLVADEKAIARNLLDKLVVYATGAEVGFSDRAEVDEMLRRAGDNGYRVRDLIHEVVQSDLFRRQ